MSIVVIPQIVEGKWCGKSKMIGHSPTSIIAHYNASNVTAAFSNLGEPKLMSLRFAMLIYKSLNYIKEPRSPNLRHSLRTDRNVGWSSTLDSVCHLLATPAMTGAVTRILHSVEPILHKERKRPTWMCVVSILVEQGILTSTVWQGALTAQVICHMNKLLVLSQATIMTHLPQLLIIDSFNYWMSVYYLMNQMGVEHPSHSSVHHGIQTHQFETWSSESNDLKTDACHFKARHLALLGYNKGWLVQC